MAVPLEIVVHAPGEPAAIVPDLQDHGCAFDHELNADGAGGGVAGDVGERFLQRAKQS